MIGQQLLPPFKHFLHEGEVLLLPGEIRRPLIQGGILFLEVLLSQGNAAGPVIQLLLQPLQTLHSRGLLGPLLLQDFVEGIQLRLELRDDLLPLVQALLLLGQLLLLPGHLQLPGIHLLEVLLVIFAVPLKLGPLEGELVGRRLGTLLQLGTPVTEALVLGLQRFPLPQDRSLGLLEGLVGAGQQPGEGNWRCFWLGAELEPPPKNHLRLLWSERRVGAGCAPASTSMAAVGAVGASSAAGNGVLDGIAVAEAVAAVGAVGTPSAAAAPLLPDPQLEPGGPVALSRWRQPRAVEAQPWEQMGRKP
jgi:hypothetical protein